MSIEAHTADQNVTKEGVVVRVGQLWQDLDSRMGGRCRYVVAVADGYARMHWLPGNLKGSTRVSIQRMHKHSTGWRLLAEAP